MSNQVTITKSTKFYHDSKEVLPPLLQTLIERAAFYKQWSEDNTREPLTDGEMRNLNAHFKSIGRKVDLEWFNSLHKDQQFEVMMGGSCMDFESVLAICENWNKTQGVTTDTISKDEFLKRVRND